MKSLKFFCGMVLFSAFISTTEVYAMDNGDQIGHYQSDLEIDRCTFIDMWKKNPNRSNAELVALTVWKLREFNRLSHIYSYPSAIKVLEKKIRTGRYKKDTEYQRWVEDKTMISPEIEQIMLQARFKDC